MHRRKSELTKPSGIWKFGLLAAVFLTFITSIPQLYFLYVRGPEWNGSCAYLDTDELPYAAYTNALIDGRPRRNDPVTGNDGQYESLFSIQFLPPFVMAEISKALNISTSTAFILLLPTATLAAALIVFWLLSEITSNKLLSAVGAVAVLSLGTAAAHSPIQLLMGVDTGYSFFPFLRRYIPALPFPIFLASTVFTWRALTRHWTWGIATAFSLVFLIFSYFFLWTATAAWLFTILLLWFIARREQRIDVLRVSGLIVVIVTPALVTYGWLLSNRAHTLDSGQLLGQTNAPDLLRAPELYGALIFALLALQLWKAGRSFKEPKILFVASFIFATFIVFNQQVLTGRSLQPFHYEEFVANYWVVIAALLALGTLRPNLPTRIVVYIAISAFGVATMLSVFAARLTLASNIRLDEARSVTLKFKEKNLQGVVFASDFRLTNSFAVTAPNPVLWSRYLYTFANVSFNEQKRRYFQYLHFSGVDETRLDHLLRNDFFARWEVFGADRTNPVLGLNSRPIVEDDIAEAVNEYRRFVASFDSALAMSPRLSYAVVSRDTNLANLDKWYERSSAEYVGTFVLYRLTPRFH